MARARWAQGDESTGRAGVQRMRIWARGNVSHYPYISLYCCVQPWHGATFGIHLAWFGFIAGWGPCDEETREQ